MLDINHHIEHTHVSAPTFQEMSLLDVTLQTWPCADIAAAALLLARVCTGYNSLAVSNLYRQQLVSTQDMSVNALHECISRIMALVCPSTCSQEINAATAPIQAKYATAAWMHAANVVKEKCDVFLASS